MASTPDADPRDDQARDRDDEPHKADPTSPDDDGDRPRADVDDPLIEEQPVGEPPTNAGGETVNNPDVGPAS